jgi:hypothetical protein
MKKSVREKIVKMSETIRKDSIQNDSVQNVNQSFEDNENDQLSTFKRSSLHENIIDQQIDSKTSDIFQTDLNEDSHQEMSNFHTDMNKSFDQRMNNLHTDMKASQSLRNLHTNMKESQSFDRQSSHSFRTSQSFQSAISTTFRKLFSLSKKKRSLFESSKSLIESSDSFNESIRSLESRRHSESDVSKIEIRSSQSSLMNQIDEISTDQISLEIIDIFERLNIANKIEKVKKIVKEKDKTKDQFKSSKSSSSRSIESSDVNSANIIKCKRNRKPNPKYAQLVYEE